MHRQSCLKLSLGFWHSSCLEENQVQRCRSRPLDLLLFQSRMEQRISLFLFFSFFLISLFLLCPSEQGTSGDGEVTHHQDL